MANLLIKLAAFARSPQGQKAIRMAQQKAKDPATQRKISQLAQRLTKRR